MTATRAGVIAEARDWIGAPFVHQGFVKAGCDCIGLVRGVGEATGALILDPAAVAPWRGYSRTPRLQTMIRALDLFLVRQELAAARPADLLCFDFGDGPQHVGILSGVRLVIHAHAMRRRTLESTIPPEVRLFRASWRYPLIEAD